MATGDVRDVQVLPKFYGSVYSVNLDVAPVPGDLLIAYEAHRADFANDWRVLPAGFTALTKRTENATSGGTLLVAYKIADGTEGQSFTFEVTHADRSRLALALIAGPLVFDEQAGESGAGPTAAYTTPSVSPADDAVVVVAVIHDKSSVDISGDAAWTTLDRGRTDVGVYSPASVFQTRTVAAGTIDADYTHPNSGRWASTVGSFLVDTVDPPDPDPPTGGDPYEPPTPAGPVLEIYTFDADADRWGSALWGTATWAAAAWHDVTPQGVTADVAWGSDEVTRGILARTVAGSWTIETYDPERKLDPANDASPYAPELVPDLPIRVNHRSLTLRTGIVESITYSEVDRTGRIRATDRVARLQAKVPTDVALADTLVERIRDAAAAGGVELEIVNAGTNPAVAAEPDDELTVWEHAANVAEERSRMLYVDRLGRLVLRDWSLPLQRGRAITAANLVDLARQIDWDGRYSVVRAPDETGASTIERAETPTPPYGKRVYERRYNTIEPEAWAARVLADRAYPGVVYLPGDVACFTADDVEYFGTIEAGELLALDSPDIAAQDGIVIGGRFRVLHQGGDAPYWRWAFYVYRTGSSALIHDVTGEPLTDDTDTDLYLIAD